MRKKLRDWTAIAVLSSCMIDMSAQVAGWVTADPKWMRPVFSMHDLARMGVLLFAAYILTEKT